MSPLPVIQFWGSTSFVASLCRPLPVGAQRSLTCFYTAHKEDHLNPKLYTHRNLHWHLLVRRILRNSAEVLLRILTYLLGIAFQITLRLLQRSNFSIVTTSGFHDMAHSAAFISWHITERSFTLPMQRMCLASKFCFNTNFLVLLFINLSAESDSIESVKSLPNCLFLLNYLITKFML